MTYGRQEGAFRAARRFGKIARVGELLGALRYHFLEMLLVVFKFLIDGLQVRVLRVDQAV